MKNKLWTHDFKLIWNIFAFHSFGSCFFFFGLFFMLHSSRPILFWFRCVYGFFIPISKRIALDKQVFDVIMNILLLKDDYFVHHLHIIIHEFEVCMHTHIECAHFFSLSPGSFLPFGTFNFFLNSWKCRKKTKKSHILYYYAYWLNAILNVHDNGLNGKKNIFFLKKSYPCEESN